MFVSWGWTLVFNGRRLTSSFDSAARHVIDLTIGDNKYVMIVCSFNKETEHSVNKEF